MPSMYLYLIMLHEGIYKQIENLNRHLYLIDATLVISSSLSRIAVKKSLAVQAREVDLTKIYIITPHMIKKEKEKLSTIAH